MVLYSITVAFIICMLLAFKGPAELYFLQGIGIDLMEFFEASFTVENSKGLIKGATVLAILVVQPLVFAFIFLKVVDKIFIAKVISEVELEIPIKARSLEHREAWFRRVGKISFWSKHERVIHEEQNIDIASVDSGGSALASVDDYLDSQKQKILSIFSHWKIVYKLIAFRGSIAQLILSITLFCGYIIAIKYGILTWVPWIILCLLLVIISPTLILYLIYFAMYVQAKNEIMKAKYINNVLIKLLIHLNNNKDSRRVLVEIMKDIERGRTNINFVVIDYMRKGEKVMMKRLRKEVSSRIQNDFELLRIFGLLSKYLHTSDDFKELSNKVTASEITSSEILSNALKHQIKGIYNQLASELRMAGETRSGRYYFQCNEFGYWLFRKFPVLGSMAKVIPIA